LVREHKVKKRIYYLAMYYVLFMYYFG